MPSTSLAAQAPPPVTRAAPATHAATSSAATTPSGGGLPSLKEKVMRIQHELSIPTEQGIVSALQSAGQTMNLQLSGTPANQADQVMKALGI